MAYAITKPVREAISEAREMIRHVIPAPPSIEAANEVRALSAVQLNRGVLYGVHGEVEGPLAI